MIWGRTLYEATGRKGIIVFFSFLSKRGIEGEITPFRGRKSPPLKILGEPKIYPKMLDRK